MKSTLLALLITAAATSGCTANVDTGSGGPLDRPDPSHGDSRGGRPSVSGTPCRFLYGEVTLADYAHAEYGEAAFSFELASGDPEVTNNEFDVVYSGNMFGVNLVTDDQSWIVDLGVVPLEEVPAMVDPDDFPLGNWQEHDYVQAHLDHTYFVRSSDGAGRGVSAFTVVGHEPGEQVTIEWIHSTAVDELIVPVSCL
ncbi:MAG: hypothetical protein KC731_40000 [Myxococcales bacterium]|nr:hypothetical protein [Myxococcales bacterium]